MKVRELMNYLDDYIINESDKKIIVLSVDDLKTLVNYIHDLEQELDEQARLTDIYFDKYLNIKEKVKQNKKVKTSDNTYRICNE